uniref:SH3 domain-containing protein n=1 Tax=Pseudonaja textilis TaxID=8673 RepID=A0A670Y563_PSETE
MKTFTKTITSYVIKIQYVACRVRKQHLLAYEENALSQNDKVFTIREDARVRELENQCRSHTEQFNFLSQELSRFHLQTGKLGLPSTSSFCSSLVTSEIVFATCQSSPQLPNGFKQKGDSIQEILAMKSLDCLLRTVWVNWRIYSFSKHSTSKHSPYIHFSYNPFDGPNENPEAELPLTAGEYIYVYGEMDEDGFFEGELMDGRRGLVPSNFVERLADDDLVAFLPQELHDLSQSSPLERSFLSISISSGERSDYSSEELNASTAPSRLEGDQGEGGISIAVPYPRKVTLIKQFASSLLVTWDPPLVPSGSCLDIQSYNVYVDTELRENVKAGSQMKAMIDKLDLKTKAYRVSIQSVSEKGSSDRLQCTFLVGCGFVLAPSQLQVRSVKATSVELSWISSNSNFSHTIYLNGGACDIVKAGIYWYTFRNLNPNTSYIATVEIQPQQTFWKPFPEGEEQLPHSPMTLSSGSPDAPLDVRVDPGPTSGILVISWLPVTIDAEGSSNGVRVTGYAVYADGQKVMEVTSPTAGSVLIEISQLQILQLCQEVTVRTVSLYGESVDSVAAQIPSALLEEVERSSESQFRGRPSRLLGGGAPALVTRTSQVPGKELPSKRSEPGNRPLNILTDHNRGSDLSDITEEEEEEDEKEEEEEKPVSGRPGEMKWNPSEYCSRENGDKVFLFLLSLRSRTWRNPSLESADDKGSMRLFVALFDYDPVSMSPNRDAAEEELPFQEGQILKVYGHKDADGFYRGECAGRTGFIPCNMVSELRVDSDSARKQLIEEGHISTDMLMESLGTLPKSNYILELWNGAFSPPPPHLSNHPSKPRRSKKGQRNSS